MKRTLLIATLLVVLLAIGVWVAFGPNRQTGDTLRSPTPPKRQEPEVPTQRYGPEGEVLLVGVISERSGESGPQNEPVYAAVRYAADRLNARGGIAGKPVALIEYDTKTQPLMATRAAQLAVKAGVVAVIGSSRSSSSLAMAPVLQKAGVLMISPESTNPEVTRVGNSIFRTCFIDPFQSRVLATFAYDTLGKRRAVTITCANRIFSKGLSQLFRSAFEKRGGTVLMNATYLEVEADFRDLLAPLAELRPEVIFVPSEVRDTGLIMQQAAALGIDATWIGPDSWNRDLLKSGGATAVGAYFSSHWHRDSDNPKSRAFVADYEAQVAPVSRAGIAMFYDTSQLLFAALEKTGGQAGEALRQAVAEITYEGICGTIRFDATGNPIDKPAVILQLTETGERFIALQSP